MKISLWLKIVFFFVVFFSTIVFNSRIVFGASIAIDPNSAGNILNGINSFSSGSFNFSTMNPALLPSTYDSINQYLYSNFGYDFNDAIDFGSDNLTGWATGQVDNPLNSADMLTSATTNFVANTMKAGLTAQALIENGYQYFAQSVPQWGENAKQFFIGKVDDVSGVISDIGDGFVTKITTNGLLAYNQIYNNLVSSGTIDNFNSFEPIYSKNFNLTYQHSGSNVRTINLTTSFGACYYTQVRNNGTYDLGVVIPSSEIFMTGSYPSFYCNGVYVNGSQVTSISFAVLDVAQQFTLNGVNYYCGKPIFNNSWSLYYNGDISLGNLDSAKYLIESSSPADSISYNYSNSDLALTLNNLLDQLVGKYVDSLTLQRINDIVSSIPIGQEVVDGVSVPVAIPTQAIVDELTGIIDEAIEDSVIYDTVFDSYYDVAIDTPADPDPPVDDSDIYVPIDVPVTPIDTIGSALTVPYMFSSIFEPIFLAFGGGLFSLWLFVPTLIIFVAIIWAIK